MHQYNQHAYGNLSVIQAEGIHHATVQVLENTGVRFNCDDALRIFKQHGFKVEGKTVFFSAAAIQQAIATAPGMFTLTARDPAKNVIVGGRHFVMAPGYGAPFVAHIDGAHTPATLEDYQCFCKLVQTSKSINVNGFMMVEPEKLAPRTAHLDMLLANMVLCDKPYMGAPTSAQAARDSLAMAAMAWGGWHRLDDITVMASLITPMSPLQYCEEMAGAIIEFARRNQACVFGTLMLAGASAPITLAGLLVQQNAEVLAGVTLTQLVRPGAPVVIGGSSSVMDMRTGGLSMGAPEFARLAAATTAMARFHNLPARAGCATADAHLTDAQCGMEAAFNLVAAIRAGSNFILHAAGMLGAYIAMSFEKFIIDEELCAMALNMLEPIVVTPETMAVEMIGNVGIGGNYLTHPATLRRCRTDFFTSLSMNRGNHTAWWKTGGLRLDQRATRQVGNRLAAYQKPEIDPGLEKELIDYVAYRKQEDLPRYATAA